MQFVITFLAIYVMSTVVGQNMHIFTLQPKQVQIKSSIMHAIIIFPNNFIGIKTSAHRKDCNLMLSELLFGVLNQIILVGTIILQIIPPMPCEIVEITFGRRHRGLDIILDTYNQKIPLAALLTLLCVELLVLFGEVFIRAIRNDEFGKKLGKGVLIGIFCLMILLIIGLIFSICILF